MWQLIARGNIQQVSHKEQHSPFGLMLLDLGIVIYITCYLYHPQKQVGCFNHRVVTLVADKLKKVVTIGLLWY